MFVLNFCDLDFLSDIRLICILGVTNRTPKNKEVKEITKDFKSIRPSFLSFGTVKLSFLVKWKIN